MIWWYSCPKSPRWIYPVFASNAMWGVYSWQAITEQINGYNNQLDSCFLVKELGLQGSQNWYRCSNLALQKEDNFHFGKHYRNGVCNKAEKIFLLSCGVLVKCYLEHYIQTWTLHLKINQRKYKEMWAVRARKGNKSYREKKKNQKD